MGRMLLRGFVAVVVAPLLALPGLGQDSQKKKLNASTLDGTSGLFKTYDSQTLQRGEINFSLGVDHYNRDPNSLVIRDLPTSVAFGLHDRVEVFGSWILQRHVDTTSIEYYRLLPGQLPRPSSTMAGVTSFTQAAPFIDVPRANGPSDLMLGGKFSVLSERKGDPLGMGLVVFTKLATFRDSVYMNRGLTAGNRTLGWAMLFSKRARKIAQLHFNTGVNFASSPKVQGNTLADLQDEFVWRGGAAFPAYGKLQFIGEIDAKAYFGSGTRGVNPQSPVDLILGLRVYITKWATLGAGYRATLLHVKEDIDRQIYPAETHGFIAQLTVGRRINRPPTAKCACANPTIKQGDTTTIRASAVDPDGDEVTYTWSATGGKLTGMGDTVTFDATGVAPGKYSVSSSVSDGELAASCVSEINVLKRNEAPTVRCEASSTSLTVGDSATVKAIATDPNNDTLSYSWTVNGAKLAADRPSITFGTAGRSPGDYDVAVSVSDGELTGEGSVRIAVIPAPKVNQPPNIEAVAPTAELPCGQSVQLAVRTSDPDGDRVTVTWSASCGSISGSGETVTYGAEGAKAGACTVTAAADDGNGGRSSATMTVGVHECSDVKFGRGSRRLDNLAKAALDDITLRMQNDLKLVATITGYTDGSRYEASIRNLAARRAQAVADYLKNKGVNASRLAVNDGGASKLIGDPKTSEGRKANRRAGIELKVR